ncbi:BrnA antitoxin family protein [Cupriavidus necator]|uniref:BrnA antitoxin family protein n=1 Tax=Cupriavidus necator TaxID=106590 RepID=UPI0039C01F76
MEKRAPLTDAGGEVRELTSEDVAQFRRADEALPASLRAKLGVRGAQKAPTKVALSLRVSPQVVEAFRATGSGWQTRMDAALIDWLKTHRPEELMV